MIEIYVDGKKLDFDGKGVTLQKEYESETENIVSSVEFSYTIEFPTSETNKEVFNFVDAFDVSNKFKRLYDAQIYADGIPVINGKLKLTSIENGKYKGNIYVPQKQSLSDILGDKQLNEIVPHMIPMNNLRDFDWINNTMLGLSTDRTAFRLPPSDYFPEYFNSKDRHVIFPYVLYGLPYMNAEKVGTDVSIYTQDCEYLYNNISENNVLPAFNVLSVVKDIFKTEGYNLTGNIFNGQLASFFNDLYQTIQYSYSDYAQNKEVPFYLSMDIEYHNFNWSTYELPSDTLEIMTVFDQDDFVYNRKDDEPDHDGQYKAGVDTPLSSYASKVKVNRDDKGMYVKTESTTQGEKGIILVPKSGWYKVKMNGKVNFPRHDDRYSTLGRTPVGGTTSEADNSTLAEQPFEIQLKRGYPMQSPKLYSFNSMLPLTPTDWSEDSTAIFDSEGEAYVKIPGDESRRYYGKNGKTTIVKNLSTCPTDDFLCGARLGGAWFSHRWGSCPYRGDFKRKNRMLTKGSTLALPNTNGAIVKTFDGQTMLSYFYKNGKTLAPSGDYLKVSDKDRNMNFEYGKNTAQVLVRADSYSNFEGYNILKKNEQNIYYWDTTSNPKAVTYEGAESSSAKTANEFGGVWDINTVVWLEEGDEVYIEMIIPMHRKMGYHSGGWFNHAHWDLIEEYVNVTDLNTSLEMCFLNSRKDWTPTPNDPIPTTEAASAAKLTNVNQFLPQIKCNDYVEKFLKTFNLQLTMVNENTFAINSLVGNKIMTNVIDIDDKCNLEEAEFTPIDTETSKEYRFKYDISETGYADGNKSPNKSHSLTPSTAPWQSSGYTGGEKITNEANSSGSIKKTESQWSYSWYKTIYFKNKKSNQNPTYYDVNTISDASLWANGMTFQAAADEPLATNKTMRLFFIGKNKDLGNKQYSYITMQYKKTPEDSDYTDYSDYEVMNLGHIYVNLPLTSNFLETVGSSRTSRIYLDYKKMNNEYDGSTYNNGLLDIFFNTEVDGGYKIKVPIALTNEEFARVNGGTLFKLNNGLYRISKIEGHDVNRNDFADLTLKTIK